MPDVGVKGQGFFRQEHTVLMAIFHPVLERNESGLWEQKEISPVFFFLMGLFSVLWETELPLKKMPKNFL